MRTHGRDLAARSHRTARAGAFTALVAGASVALGGAVALTPSEAQACGGCFGPPSTTEQQQVVSDHRMVMAVHPTESILWDQFRYSGRAEDFAWVLPVFGDVRIEVASADFFDKLDAATAVQVRGPQLIPQCPARNSGPTLGFGGSAPSRGGEAASDAGASGGGVQVLGEEVVGPYETVRLRATDSMALTDWLRAHNYTIPRSIEGTIEAYTRLRMDFVALRLRSGEGVQAMQPVRIRYATANMVLPLRMVAAGVADKVGITLWIFGRGRFEAANFLNGRIDERDLVWDWAGGTGSSNYRDVWNRTLRMLDGGRAWITEMAMGASNFESNVLYSPPPTRPGSGAVPWSGTPSVELLEDWNLAVGDAGSGGATITRMRTDLLARFLDVDLTLASAFDSSDVSNALIVRRETGARPAVPCAGGTWRVQAADGQVIDPGVPPGTPGSTPDSRVPVAACAVAVPGGARPRASVRWLGLAGLSAAVFGFIARRRTSRRD